jgi:hypothetical protein
MVHAELVHILKNDSLCLAFYIEHTQGKLAILSANRQQLKEKLSVLSSVQRGRQKIKSVFPTPDALSGHYFCHPRTTKMDDAKLWQPDTARQQILMEAHEDRSPYDGKLPAAGRVLVIEYRCRSLSNGYHRVGDGKVLWGTLGANAGSRKTHGEKSLSRRRRRYREGCGRHAGGGRGRLKNTDGEVTQ